jgi:hypothetical protein
VIDIHQVGYHEKKKKKSFKKASVLKNVKYYYLFGPLFVEEKIHENNRVPSNYTTKS